MGASNTEWKPNTDSPFLEAFVESEVATIGETTSNVFTRDAFLDALKRAFPVHPEGFDAVDAARKSGDRGSSPTDAKSRMGRK